MQRVEFEPGVSWVPDCCPRRHGHGGITFWFAIFDEIIQLLLQSKVAKAESYLLGGYHNELLELPYHIETLSQIIWKIFSMYTPTKKFPPVCPIYHIKWPKIVKKSLKLMQNRQFFYQSLENNEKKTLNEFWFQNSG